MPSGSVTIPDLGDGVRDILDNAVQIDSIDTEDGGITIVFAADDGRSARVTIPVSRWAREGNADPIPAAKLSSVRQVPTGGQTRPSTHLGSNLHTALDMGACAK